MTTAINIRFKRDGDWNDDRNRSTGSSDSIVSLHDDDGDILVDDDDSFLLQSPSGIPPPTRPPLKYKNNSNLLIFYTKNGWSGSLQSAIKSEQLPSSSTSTRNPRSESNSVISRFKDRFQTLSSLLWFTLLDSSCWL